MRVVLAALALLPIVAACAPDLPPTTEDRSQPTAAPPPAAIAAKRAPPRPPARPAAAAAANEADPAAAPPGMPLPPSPPHAPERQDETTVAPMPSSSAASATLTRQDAPPPGPALAATGGGYRVQADGTIGCADPVPLRILRGMPQLERTHPRLSGRLLEEGRCLTTFRVNTWSLVREEGDVVLLHLTNPAPGSPAITLWFMRSDLLAAD